MKLFKLLILTVLLAQSVQAGRYYSSEYGRFVQRDPLGYVDGMSLYNAYFAQDFGVDPSGTISGSKKLKYGTIKWTGVETKDIYISFQYSNNCPCDYIDFVQVIRTVDNKGNAISEGDKRLEADDKTVVDGAEIKRGRVFKHNSEVHTVYYVGSVTQDKSKKRKYKPYSGFSSNTGGKKNDQVARLYDKPGGRENATTFFETCAVCVDNGRILGCLTWSVKRQNAVKKITPGTASEEPTGLYKKGVEAWDNWVDNGEHKGHTYQYQGTHSDKWDNHIYLKKQ